MNKSTTSPSNTQLVQRCLQGDEGAWQLLVDRYARLVHWVALRHNLTAAEADDIGQDVFLLLAQHLHQVADPERLGAWLATTARRLCWRAVQRRRHEAPGATADLADLAASTDRQSLGQQVGSAMADLLAGWSRQEAISTGMQSLRPRCRELLTLLFLDPSEPDYGEISRRLDIPLGSIGPTRNRCLDQLRAILEGLGYDATG